ncbi:hypothetical protein COLO4_04121 [Corchorus olitorius]|uniref:BURP domain-containing protein n=1 Tax=Corchorus olitorius TaxID=93759 RepID=A0A1R3KV72_9ROSI|nr:hypothetical protein COLO4_04121 [Corchorus olitorius]
MAFHNFLVIFALLILAIARSHATLTKEELHWKLVFPNTPMPKILKDILPPPGQSTIFRGSVSPDADGVNDPEFGAYWYDGAYDDNSIKGSKAEDDPNNKGVNDPEFGAYGYDYEYKDSSKESRGGRDSDPNNEGVNDPEFGAYGYDYEYKDSAKESRGHDSDPNNEGVNDPEFGAYGYDYEYKDSAKGPRGTAPSSKGIKNSLGRKSGYEYDIGTIKETIYFFQEDLRPGKKMNLKRLTEKSDKALFLPQQIAKSMPISTDKLPKILKNFSIKAESSYAKGVGVTVMNCERAEMRGEEKYCATSLESFVDLGVAMFGKNIRLLSHQLGKGLKNPLVTIDRGMRDMGENNIVCHKMQYPYAVYLCHSIKKTIVYDVPLIGVDGTKVNAVAVCHLDTSAWSPKHVAFQFLKVKPGSVPICHFLGRDTIVWVSN